MAPTNRRRRSTTGRAGMRPTSSRGSGAEPPTKPPRTLLAICKRLKSAYRVVMRADIVPGALFPDYQLSDHRGTRRRLSECQGIDPMVLVLARGGFCPKDRRQHEGLLQLYREMQVGYCRLVTLST